MKKKATLTVPRPLPHGREQHAVITYIERQHGLGDVLLTDTPLRDEMRSHYALVTEDVPDRLTQRAKVLWWQRAEHLRTLVQPALRHIESGMYFPELLDLAIKIAESERWEEIKAILSTFPERTSHTSEAEWAYAALRLWCRETWLFSIEMRQLRQQIDAHTLASVDPVEVAAGN